MIRLQEVVVQVLSPSLMPLQTTLAQHRPSWSDHRINQTGSSFILPDLIRLYSPDLLTFLESWTCFFHWRIQEAHGVQSHGYCNK